MAKLNGDNQKPFNCFKKWVPVEKSTSLWDSDEIYFGYKLFYIFHRMLPWSGKTRRAQCSGQCKQHVAQFRHRGRIVLPLPIYKNGTIRNVCSAMCKAETEYGLRRNCTLRCKILFILLLYILRSKHNSLSGSMLVAKRTVLFTLTTSLCRSG